MSIGNSVSERLVQSATSWRAEARRRGHPQTHVLAVMTDSRRQDRGAVPTGCRAYQVCGLNAVRLSHEVVGHDETLHPVTVDGLLPLGIAAGEGVRASCTIPWGATGASDAGAMLGAGTGAARCGAARSLSPQGLASATFMPTGSAQQIDAVGEGWRRSCQRVGRSATWARRAVPPASVRAAAPTKTATPTPGAAAAVNASAKGLATDPRPTPKNHVVESRVIGKQPPVELPTTTGAALSPSSCGVQR